MPFFLFVSNATAKIRFDDIFSTFPRSYLNATCNLYSIWIMIQSIHLLCSRSINLLTEVLIFIWPFGSVDLICDLMLAARRTTPSNEFLVSDARIDLVTTLYMPSSQSMWVVINVSWLVLKRRMPTWFRWYIHMYGIDRTWKNLSLLHRFIFNQSLTISFNHRKVATPPRELYVSIKHADNIWYCIWFLQVIWFCSD